MTLRTFNGAVVVNAFWRGGDEGATKILKELGARGVNMRLVRTDELFCRIDGGVKCEQFDFAVYLDKDNHVAQMLEGAGVRLFNSAEAIFLADDKMLTHIALAKAKLPQPKTFSSPLCFAGEDKGEWIEKVQAELGYPIVIKKCHGAFGKEVYLAKNAEEVAKLRRTLMSEPHIYQEYIECGASDYRVIVIGGKAVAGMKRTATAEGEFRSNIELGGKGEKAALTGALSLLAEKCADALRLCFAGVDILYANNRYYVTEVNSNAHFAGIERATGVNIAGVYADYIVGEMDNGRRE